MKKEVTRIFSVFDGRVRRIVYEYTIDAGDGRPRDEQEKEYRLVRTAALLKKVSDTEYEEVKTGKRLTV